MTDLYPAIEPYAIHRIKVGEPHELYVEECGNRDGLAAVFLHGGPGSGIETYHRRLFDPEKYRVVLFDQRGAGRSTPHACLDDNDTWALIADMETIREKLGIEKWLVFGGSWGSTLALAYAQKHPERVSALVLRGIFMCRPQEIEWFYQQGAHRIYPDYWQDYVGVIPEAERGDMVAAYYQRLTADDEATRLKAAHEWSVWEGRTATLLAREEVVEHFADPHVAVSLARIECHYFMHNAFLEPDQLLRDAHKLKDIPGVIVQGRYDMVCPMESAWELHRAWPEAELIVVEDAGHAASEPGIIKALVDANNRLAARLA